jgi:hypothetical protein
VQEELQIISNFIELIDEQGFKMRYIYINTLFLIVLDVLISSILYYFMEYEGLALPVILIRAIGLLVIFPLTFWSIGHLQFSEIIKYVLTFIIGYFLIVLIFQILSPTNDNYFKTLIKLHKDFLVFLPIFLPYILAFFITVLLSLTLSFKDK